jgi:hypothetical protein
VSPASRATLRSACRIGGSLTPTGQPASNTTDDGKATRPQVDPRANYG